MRQGGKLLQLVHHAPTGSFFQSPFGLDGFERGWNLQPSVDVTDTAEEILVRIELPGVAAEDLDLTLSGDILTIAGSKEESREQQDRNLYFSDRRFGNFRRSVQLPCKVDRDRVQAESKDGILTVRLMKIEAEKPKRIEISAR